MTSRARWRVRTAGAAPRSALVDEVRSGLSGMPKHLACRFFYDALGSRLFEEICRLDEYYLTRCEDEILARASAEIVACTRGPATIVELGSGSASKTRRILSAEIARSGSTRYVPIDISRSALEESARSLSAQFEELVVDAIEGEYEEGLELVEHGAGATLVLWLGSNVGNFDRASAARFLGRVRDRLRPGDAVLLGADLRKSRELLEPAYDDARGITARFNKNLLARINAELGGDFDLDAFRHVAHYDEVEGRVEMHLESLRAQRVEIRALRMQVDFARGERIHTEDSYKHSFEELDALASASGFAITRRWLDRRGWFAESLLVPR